jgi:hypothetical protein
MPNLTANDPLAHLSLRVGERCPGVLGVGLARSYWRPACPTDPIRLIPPTPKGGAGAASSAPVRHRPTVEAVAADYASGDLPPCALRVRRAHAPTPRPAVVNGSLPPDPPAEGRHAPAHARPVARARPQAGRARPRALGGRRRGPNRARITGVGGPERGYDAGKKAFGRKRHILVDASGLILLAHIHAASLHAFVGARPRVEAAPVTALPRLELIWAHGACTGPCAKWLERQITAR